MPEIDVRPAGPDQEDRLMAALAHASVLLFGMGLVAAIVLWVTQRERSRYVAVQALQAVIYHLAGFGLFVAGMGCWMALYLATLIPVMAAPEEPASLWIFMVATLLMFVPFLQMGLWIAGGLWGAVRCLRGHDFRYAIIGRWVEGR
jgi:uncharacterized Tic20 family protein